MKKQWSFILAALMAVMAMTGCSGGSSDTSGGSGAGGVTVTYSISGTITSGGAALADVTVSTNGGSATSNASGVYTISGLANGNYTITPVKTGFTFTPATLALTVNGANLTDHNFTATAAASGTYSISGAITNGGSALVGVTVTLAGSGSATATTDSSGNFSFTGTQNGSFTITPSKAGYIFTPASQVVTVNGADISSQSFSAADIAPVAKVKVSSPFIYYKPGKVVTLDGSGSNDANNNPLTYSWSFFRKPTGSNAVLSDPVAVKPTFTPDVASNSIFNYIVNLTVNNGITNSTEAKGYITVTTDLSILVSPSHTSNYLMDGSGNLKPGTTFDSALKNLSDESFSLTKYELRNGTTVIWSTTSPADLNNNIIGPGQTVSIPYTQTTTLKDNGHEYTYYLTDPLTNIIYTRTGSFDWVIQ